MEKILIAKILKPQGIKGELKCKPLTDMTDKFSDIKAVEINGKEYSVDSFVCRFGFAYLSLSEIKDRNLAETFRNKDVFASKENFDGNILISDIEGCFLYDETNKLIGQVVSVEQYGSADILNVKETSGAKFSVPLVDAVVKRIVVSSKTIIVDKSSYKSSRIVYEDWYFNTFSWNVYSFKN